MTKKVLTLYDVMGIQNFIFSTNKLKENVGSSYIVQDILDRYLREILDLKCGTKLLDNLTNDNDFLDKDYKAVIIYIAGGNAFIIFDSENTAKDVTYELSKKILVKTDGLLNLAVAYKETDFTNFQNDFSELLDLIELNKFEFIRSSPLLSIGITKQELSSGLPAQRLEKYIEGGREIIEYLSYSSHRKRIAAEDIYHDKDERGYNKKYLGKNFNYYKFPMELDNLGQKKGENYIAIVHIDGNEIGDTRYNLIKDIKDPKKTLATLYEFSEKLNDLFIKSVELMVDNLITALKNPQFKKKFKIKSENGKDYLPIRPLIMNGDDITFICNGKLGIGLAENFLKVLNKKRKNFVINGKEEPIPITASCGVLIVKTKFPFYRAYEITEELCRSAKIKGKIVEENNKKEFYKKGHWFDFHICQSGISMSLKEIRDQKFNLIGCENASDLKIESHGIIELKQRQFNLLIRPWCLVGKSIPKYMWSNLKAILQKFEDNKWPRNKLIKFKKALLSSKEQVDQFLIEISKDKHMQLDNIWDDEITPYFDALEFMDYYIPIDGGENKN